MEDHDGREHGRDRIRQVHLMRFADLLATAAAQGSGGGGAPSYTASAVTFNSTGVRTLSLAATDTDSYSFSVWLKIGDGLNAALFVVDPETAYANYGEKFDWGGEFAVVFGNVDANSTRITVSGYAEDTWIHVLGSIRVSAGVASGRVYVNDTSVGTLAGLATTETQSFNTKSFYLGGDSYGAFYVGDMADFWWSSSSLLSGGDIPEATRRLFITAGGKPVNPTGFPAGEVLLSGNASTFATNQGTGGAFSVTGGSLTNAATSPSD